MLRARDLMGAPPVTVAADATVGEAADLMLERGISCLPVLDGSGRLVGIVTHSDFGLQQVFKPLGENLFKLLGSWASPKTLEDVARSVRERTVREVMSRPVVTVTEDTTVNRVVELMLAHRIHRVPVVRGETVVGVLSRHDMLKLVADGRYVPAQATEGG